MKFRIVIAILLAVNAAIYVFNTVKLFQYRAQLAELQEKANGALTRCVSNTREAQAQATRWKNLAWDAYSGLDRATATAQNAMGAAHDWERLFCRTTEGRTVASCKAVNHGRP